MGTGSTSRGITETDVWQAADALLLEGARPTIERVRQKVGRGSPNTVSPYLDTWFRKLGARIKDPMAFSAPPAIPDPVHQAALHFWEAALASAREQIASELAAEREALGAERLAASEERTVLNGERERLAAQAQAKDDVAQALRAQLVESVRQVDDLRDQVRAQAAELLAACDQHKILTTERDRWRVQLDAERAAQVKARDEVETRAAAHEKRWTMEVDRAREAVKTTQAQTKKLERDTAARIDKVSRELAQAADDKRRTLDIAAKREAAQAAQIERLQVQLTRAMAQLDAKDQEHGVLLRSLLGKTKPVGVGAGAAKRRPATVRR